MSYCYCDDYSMPSFFSEKFISARKNHKCCECGATINSGDEYQYVSGKWDGDFQTFKTCEKCANLRFSLNDIACPTYGGLYEEYFEYLLHMFDAISAKEQYLKVRGKSA